MTTNADEIEERGRDRISRSESNDDDVRRTKVRKRSSSAKKTGNKGISTKSSGGNTQSTGNLYHSQTRDDTDEEDSSKILSRKSFGDLARQDSDAIRGAQEDHTPSKKGRDSSPSRSHHHHHHHHHHHKNSSSRGHSHSSSRGSHASSGKHHHHHSHSNSSKSRDVSPHRSRHHSKSGHASPERHHVSKHHSKSRDGSPERHQRYKHHSKSRDGSPERHQRYKHHSKSRDASPERHHRYKHHSKSRDASPDRHHRSKHHSKSRDASPEPRGSKHHHHSHSASKHHHHSHSASVRSRDTSPVRHHSSKHHYHSHSASVRSRDTSPVRHHSSKHHKHHSSSRHHSRSRDTSPTRDVIEVIDDGGDDVVPPSAEELTHRRLSHSKDTGSLEMKSPPSNKALASLKHSRASSGPSIAQRDQYLGECLMRDTHQLVHQFFEAYQEVADDLDRPNVLVAGITGAGKSSLINSVFGADLAATGSGSPVTKGFAEYSLPDVPVRIFDSKGLETGQHEEFLAMTGRFFEEHQQLISAGGKARVHDMIHAIWYIVSASAARFHPFERELISSGLFGEVPLFILLSKCDIATPEQVRSVRRAIEQANFPNLVGIFETVSADHTADKVITKCPACGSTELLVSTRSMIALCESCGQSSKASLPTGLEQVIEMTHDAIPAVVRDAFISAQSVSFSLKNARAHRIITDFAAEAAHVHLSGTLVRSIAKMLTRLSILWNFRQYGHLYGTRIAKDVVHHMNFRDKVFVFVHKNHDHVNRSIALGYLWCNCVRQLAAEALNTSILFAGRTHSHVAAAASSLKAEAEAEASKELDQHWSRILELCFSDLNDENIMLTEHRIEREGIVALLEEAFPTTGAARVPPRLSSPSSGAALARVNAAAASNAIGNVAGDSASVTFDHHNLTSASQPLMFSTRANNSAANMAALHVSIGAPQPVATPPPQTVVASVTPLSSSSQHDLQSLSASSLH